MIELLAPAQTVEHGIAAIDCGADAVYIGASDFGARKSASNSLTDIKRLTDYAHFFNAKVYVTVNTILTDDELNQAQKLVNELYKIKVDAIIVQDMALLNIELPPIPIYASTQCDNRFLDKINFFEKIGIKRVILARELSLSQIKEICDNTNLEIETFIHGALCVSYSGQCYLSASIGGRSANRGECAQPCRKKYSLVDVKSGKYIVKDKHLLSLKDFNASKHIKKLAEIGVTSFKIEGRLKNINYVKNVVSYYRNLIDDFAEKSSSGRVITDFKPDINKTFNRGYTDYFLEKRKNICNFETPNFIGEKIGVVDEVQGNCFVINGKDVHPQDGVCFFVNGVQDGFLVNKVIGNKIYPNKRVDLHKGIELYRNYDVEFEKELSGAKFRRVLDVKSEIKKNVISAIDEDGIMVEVSMPDCEAANNQENMKRIFIEQFSKTGNTNVEFVEINLKTDVLPYMKISQINELRRSLIEKLKEARINNYKNNKQDKLKTVEYPQKVLNYKANIYNQRAKEFYEKCGAVVSEYAFEAQNNYSKKELMRTKHCLKFALGKCGNKEEWMLEDSQNKRYPLEFDCSKCEMAIKHS
ncbi:MAG: U32 family peptidase [bacterium]|nr:U32 family peptidase [bacterium]